MLQIKGVSKTYKTKNKILVKALDDVSLDISEKGMVFVLGKSGSGKSTLLNVLGGLDSADCGEINICGKSSKNFSQSDFDSYRNTFIGFIFQEYNILNEFSVGANIALAMELQGKKATDEALNKILEQVDLSGYADRKPNTLSGGQKQRVAIARALIKEPEIIMADEPTGALDSNTGKQVFDTLKKLSKEKLVIVVSHDREFAEQYADRIIELADGKIISDVIKHTVDSSKKSLGVSIIGDKIIHIKKGYSLTETDLKLINEYLKNNAQSDSLISLDGRANSEFKKAAKINDIGAREVFDEAKSGDIQLKSYDVTKFKLIKSRLPFKNSAKIAASGLKTKPFRLFMTILLSTIAFTLFGLASTMSTYNKADASLSSINDSKVNYVAIKQMTRMENGTYDYYQTVSISDKELQKLREKFPNLHFTPLYPGTLNSGKNTPLSNIADFEALEGHETFSYYFKRFSGIMPIDEALIAKNEFKLIGSYPANDDEVVITDYIYEHYKRAGYANDIQDITISSENDLIGRTITLNISGSDKEMKIVGILNTNLDGSRYEKFKSKPNTNTNPNATVTDNVMNYVLYSELDTLISQSYHSAAFVSPENFKKIAVLKNDFIETNGNRYNIELRIDDNYMSSRYVSSLKNVEKSDLIMFDKNKTELADDEIMLSLNSIVPIIKNITQNEGKLIDIDNVNYDELKNKIVTVGLYVRNSSKVKNYSMKIVGINKNENDTSVFSDKFIDEINGIRGEGIYSVAVANMPEKSSEKMDIIEFCYDSTDKNKETGYELRNSVSTILNDVNGFIESGSKIFIYVGIVFAVFAALMLTNFIATSISYKKREIGILRAVGARGYDVFGIFFNESMMIALMNWLTSTVFTIGITMFINYQMRVNYGILITILNFGIIQVITMIAISIFVAFIASFIPVYRTSKKKPIDAIRSY